MRGPWPTGGGAVVPKKTRCEFNIIIGVELCDMMLFAVVGTQEVLRKLPD